MFNDKKALIVVYKDELLVNQLKKLVETRDDEENKTIGTKDNTIDIASWTEKVWLDRKKEGIIKGKVLFLGDIKGTDKLEPVIDIKFNRYGVKYGWAGNQALLCIDLKTLSKRKDYDDFLEELSRLPVPTSFKTGIKEAENESIEEIEPKSNQTKNKQDNRSIIESAKHVISVGIEAVNEAGAHVASKTEEVFRDKKMMKRQMMLYGIINFYNKSLEEFISN